MEGSLVRLRDLSVVFENDGRVRLRSRSRGVGAIAPPIAVELLALAGEPVTEDDAAQRLGEGARPLFRALAAVGLLVPAAEAERTPVFFDNYADVDVHRRMLGDRVRTAAFATALRRAVEPGMAVLDAGTGSGLLACLAARAGAGVVYAVDASEMATVAREVVRANGLEDRVRVIRADLATVELPQPIDLVVSETLGPMAFAEGASRDLRACLARHLAPAGRVLPDRIDLWMAPVGGPELLEDVVGAFDEIEGIDLAALRSLALGRSRSLDLAESALLSPGRIVVSEPWPAASTVHGTASFTVTGNRDWCGWACWFEARLGPDLTLSTGPTDPPTHWRQVFLPMEPVSLSSAGADLDGAAATIDVRLTVREAADDRRGLEVEIDWTLGAAGGRTVHRVR